MNHISLELEKYVDEREIKNKTNLSEKELYKKGDLIKDNTINNLDFDNVEKSTFINDVYRKYVKTYFRRLCTFQNFNFFKKKKKQIFLNRLNKDEYIRKSTIKNVHYAAIKLYLKEYKAFQANMSIVLKLPADSTAKESKKYLTFKVKSLIKSLSHALTIQNHKILEMLKVYLTFK